MSDNFGTDADVNTGVDQTGSDSQRNNTGVAGATDTGEQQQQQQTDGDNTPIYTKAQMSKIVSDRVNELNTYKKTVEAMAKLTGMSEQQIVSYIEQQNNQAMVAANLQQQQGYQQNQQQSYQQQTSTDYATRMALAAGQVAVETKRQLELSSLQSNPIYSDIFEKDEVKENVLNVANATGLSVKEAYWQLYGETKAIDIQKNTEQRVLANMQARAGLGAVSDLSTSEELKKLNLDADEIAFAQKSGMFADLKEFAALKNVTNLDDFEKAFNKK